MNYLSRLITSATALLCVSLSSPTAMATESEVETVRPVTSAFSIEAGTSHITDTYLSPLKYSGWSTAFSYERMQAMRFNPERWVMQLALGVELDKTNNQARNASIWGLELKASWSMMHRWRMESFAPRLTLAVGGNIGVSGGALYCNRNGNNPVAAKADALLSLTGYAAYNLKVGRVPVTLRYQPTLPVTGAFFSPDYGELYYEIYLGDTSGLVHPAWWGNFFRLDNLLTADIHLGATSLRLGYNGRIESIKINNITTRTFTHRALIGVSGEWMSLNPRHRLSLHARMVSALY